ncbi:MAG: heavy-metal-associated domain-containing protein [Clostridia bacterium]|nr:heavy-metal-associated domain-containing protein [Clostridia bacterium]
MKKIIEINGMHCPKCAGRVENALNSIEGVSAKVNLAKKQAVVTLKTDVSDGVFKNAVNSLGFEVISIAEKKGLLG